MKKLMLILSLMGAPVFGALFNVDVSEETKNKLKGIDEDFEDYQNQMNQFPGEFASKKCEINATYYFKQACKSCLFKNHTLSWILAYEASQEEMDICALEAYEVFRKNIDACKKSSR